jgi:uncharacterized protein (DUF433 family)
LPRYSHPEAARATGVPATTIGAWVRGHAYPRKHDRGYSSPVIHPLEIGRLSFNNLIEIHVLRGLRTSHGVRLDRVREALGVAEREFGIQRLLVNEQLRFSAGRLFLDRYGTISELNPTQQIAMRAFFDGYLKRIDFGTEGLPKDFYPVERTISDTSRKLILVSPLVSFGRAVIQSVGVSTHIIADRLNAGEPEESIIDDYGLAREELEEAAAYEAAA